MLTPADGAMTAAPAGDCRGGEQARISTRATGELQSKQLLRQNCMSGLFSLIESKMQSFSGIFTPLVINYNYFMKAFLFYTNFCCFFSTQFSNTNWKKALDAWFWDEIDLFPVSSVYRFKRTLKNNGKFISSQVSAHKRNRALQSNGMGQDLQSGLRPHGVQDKQLGGQVS